MKKDSDIYFACLEDISQASWGRICVIASSYHMVSFDVVYWIIGRRSKVVFQTESVFLPAARADANQYERSAAELPK